LHRKRWQIELLAKLAQRRGSQNQLLCQLTANRTGLPVLAGPVEATAIGNVLVQARTQGLATGTLDNLRALVARTFTPAVYKPQSTPD